VTPFINALSNNEIEAAHLSPLTHKTIRNYRFSFNTCIAVLVKTVVSITLYVLFLVDAHRDRYWPALDDYVYTIRASGATIELILGVALLLNGVWILVFESVGLIRALMIGVHAYCNIWSQAREGWASFRRRRDAVLRIDALRDAGEEDVRRASDVCAICYQDMRIEGQVGGVKVTECAHLFHAVCLRKWLYMDERCPMCHRKVFAGAPPAEEATN